MCETTVPMPKYRPVPIPTKDKPWYKQAWIMLTVTRQIELTEDYRIYVPSLGCIILIPKGFICDLASVPRPLWVVIPPDGILMIGGIVHDFYYKYHCLFESHHMIICEGNGKTFGDKLFKEVNVLVNDMPIISSITTATLIGFGWFAWWKHRRRNCNVFTDYPFAKRVTVGLKYE